MKARKFSDFFLANCALVAIMGLMPVANAQADTNPEIFWEEQRPTGKWRLVQNDELCNVEFLLNEPSGRYIGVSWLSSGQILVSVTNPDDLVPTAKVGEKNRDNWPRFNFTFTMDRDGQSSSAATPMIKMKRLRNWQFIGPVSESWLAGFALSRSIKATRVGTERAISFDFGAGGNKLAMDKLRECATRLPKTG